MADTFLSIEFDWDAFEVSYHRVMRAMRDVQDPQVRNEVAGIYADLIEPWVPYKSGALSNSRQIKDGQIIYDANHAAPQYFAPDKKWNRETGVHPLATSKWDEVADNFIWDSFRKKAGKIIRNQIINQYNHELVSFFRGGK